MITVELYAVVIKNKLQINFKLEFLTDSGSILMVTIQINIVAV